MILLLLGGALPRASAFAPKPDEHPIEDLVSSLIQKLYKNCDANTVIFLGAERIGKEDAMEQIQCTLGLDIGTVGSVGTGIGTVFAKPSIVSDGIKTVDDAMQNGVCVAEAIYPLVKSIIPVPLVMAPFFGKWFGMAEETCGVSAPFFGMVLILI